MCEPVDRDVRGQVVDAVQRLAESERVRLRCGDTDEQLPGQTGTRGDGNGIDITQADAGLLQRTVHGWHDRFEMRTAGDLGHHTAEARMLFDAGCQRIGKQLAATHDADTCLVT